MPQIKQGMFYRSGKILYALRWWVIGLWVLLLLSSIPFIPQLITPFKTIGFVDETAKSTLAQQQLDQALGYNTNNQLIILYHSPTLLASDPRYMRKVKDSLVGLNDFPVKLTVFFPDDNPKQISKDKHTAYVAIIFKELQPISPDVLQLFKSKLKPPQNMSMVLGGEPVFIEDVNQQTQTDLFYADLIAAPVALITLIIVFGSVVAASIPLFLGAGGALMILTFLFVLGHFVSLSIFTLNIALLLGLCLCLDYTLFIVSRFRDELRNYKTIQKAIAVTQATAGKAIFFSGLAVFASLSALLLFPVNILFSVAIGGMAAVVFAVLSAILFLPAFLSVLHTNINRLPVRMLKRRENHRAPFWNWLARTVVHRPLTFFFPVFIVLLMLGYPLFSAHFGVADFRIFPEHSKNRIFFDTYAKKFNLQALSPIQLTITTDNGSILNRTNLDQLYDFTQTLQKHPAISEVNSIVTLKPPLSKEQYYYLYHGSASNNPTIKKLLASTTRNHFTLIRIVSKYPTDSPQTNALINDLSTMNPGPGMTVQLSGKPLSNRDVMKRIMDILPYALLWIILSSYFILLFLLRSLLLPIKAIVMNLLSLCACYGALVLVFQYGYLHEWLHFQPQGMLDISLLVIIFCALFGFSMDYEVFLLSRIKESYEKHQDNKLSIIHGIEKSSRIITCAALIVIVICGSFLVAHVLIIKAFGLGIAVAIFVDAFLIRTLLVPSVMALLKGWNWYLPKWLDKILP